MERRATGEVEQTLLAISQGKLSLFDIIVSPELSSLLANVKLLKLLAAQPDLNAAQAEALMKKMQIPSNSYLRSVRDIKKKRLAAYLLQKLPWNELIKREGK